MALEHKPFENRVGRIMQQRRSWPAATACGRQQQPDRAAPAARDAVFPWRGLCLALLIGLAFKAYLLATFDAPPMRTGWPSGTGRPVERAGAWVMQPDRPPLLSHG